MADTVTKWDNGQKPRPGVPSNGAPYCTFRWNKPDTSSHAALTSDYHNYFGRHFSYVINVDAADTGTGVNYACTVLGSNSLDLDDAKWDSASTATIAAASIQNMASRLVVNEETLGATLGTGRYRYYKLKIDPSADPGANVAVKVEINHMSQGDI
jgi:hypothetical protein